MNVIALKVKPALPLLGDTIQIIPETDRKALKQAHQVKPMISLLEQMSEKSSQIYTVGSVGVLYLYLSGVGYNYLLLAVS